MAVITEPYVQGTPCWIDLMAGDQQAAIDFYADLLGWSGTVGPAEFGGYAVCELRGKAVGGIGAAMSMDEEPTPPPAWTTYLAVDDIEATAAKVTANGGTVLVPPMRVGDNGHMLVCTDPSGAVVGAWQRLDFGGAERVNEPGALIWNELNTRDLDKAVEFYEAVFGARFESMPEVPGYRGMLVAGRVVGGAQVLSGAPPEVPSHWLAYFAVDDTDSTTDAAVHAGSTLIMPPFDMPAGRMSVVQDPQGAVFALLKPSPIGEA